MLRATTATSMRRYITTLLFFLSITFFSTLSALITTPADISLIVLDVKYNEKQGVKICEVQSSTISRFAGSYPFLTGDDSFPHRFHELIAKRFNHTWYRKGDLRDPLFCDTLFALGWKIIYKWDFFSLRNPLYPLATAIPTHPESLDSYCGVVYMRGRPEKSLQELRRCYPSLIFVNAFLEGVLGDKKFVNNLLEKDPLLSSVRPKCKSYPAIYSPQLVDDILEAFDSELLVIKPRNGTKGRGVIILKREELATTLHYILAEDKERLREHEDCSYSFWGKKTIRNFLIEEFVPSDPLYVDHLQGNPYDPTIRVVATLLRDKGKTEVVFLGGYCKLPAVSLNTVGENLNLIHKSCGQEPYFAALPPELSNRINKQLLPPLRKLHRLLLLNPSQAKQKREGSTVEVEKRL